MKTALIATVLAATTSTTFASGLSINSVDQKNIQPTKVEITEIKVQGPTDAFNVKIEAEDRADTSAFKQSYDGRS